MEQVLSWIELLFVHLAALKDFPSAVIPILAAAILVLFLRRPGKRRRKLPAPFDIDAPYVIDGDTIAKGGLRVRLFGIDAPETGQRQGKAATRHLRHLLGTGTVQIIPQDVDVYDRIVARVFKGGEDICQKMVEDGYAVACTDYTSLYASHQSRARRKRAGLWRYGAIQNPAGFRRRSS